MCIEHYLLENINKRKVIKITYPIVGQTNKHIPKCLLANSCLRKVEMGEYVSIQTLVRKVSRGMKLNHNVQCVVTVTTTRYIELCQYVWWSFYYCVLQSLNYLLKLPPNINSYKSSY